MEKYLVWARPAIVAVLGLWLLEIHAGNIAPNKFSVAMVGWLAIAIGVIQFVRVIFSRYCVEKEDESGYSTTDGKPDWQ